MTKFGITYQQQPTGVTCVQTCLAMCLGKDVQEIIKKYGEGAMNTSRLVAALVDEHVYHNQMVSGSMIYQGWYFVCVPSLNIRGGHHQILVHSTDETGLFVFDPSQKERYKENGDDLASWCDLIPFWPQ